MDKVNDLGPHNNLLATVSSEVDSMSVQLMCMEEYDDYYGIFYHDSRYTEETGDVDLRPMAAVAMHPKEQYGSYGPLEHKMYRYMINGIKDRYGVSWSEFVLLSRRETEIMFKSNADWLERQAKLQAAAEAAAREATDGKSGR